MCNCFCPTTFFSHSCSFSFTHHNSLPIHHLTLPHNLQLRKRDIPKCSSNSNGYDNDFWLNNREEAVNSASRIEKQQEIPSPSKEIDDDRGVGFLEFDSKMEKGIVQRKKQMMKRSNLIAKQVISIHSALTLGFVSQLWVDINSWIVFLVEVRPNLLSGESEKFLLEDIKQVGDVVLVEDESVMENEFKLVGLQTLVCSLTSCWFRMGIIDTKSIYSPCAPGQ